MTRLEDRLREDLPALVDLIMDEQITGPDQDAGAISDGTGLIVELKPQPTHGMRRWPAVALAAAAAAAIVGIGALVLNTRGGTEVATVEPPSADVVVPSPAGSNDGIGLVPEEGVTSPMLRWTEIDRPFERAYGLDSVGDGRILTRVLEADGWRVAVTPNGADWMDVPIPDGIQPGHIDISGDRWLVAGFEVTDEAESLHHLGVLQHLGERVFYSDDEGATWIELPLDLPSGPTPVPYVIKRSRLGAALVDGEQIVLAVSSVTVLDLWTLMEDRGLALDAEEISAVGWTTRDITIEHRQAGDPDPQRSVFTFEELGLNPDQVAVLRDLGADGITRIFASDGSALDLVGAYSGWNTYGVVGADGFVLHVKGSTDLMLMSADGTDWTEIPMDPSYQHPPYPAAVDNSGSIWVVTTVAGAATVVKSLDPLDGFETVAILEGVVRTVELDAGPAGLAATARAALDNVDGTPELHDPWTWGGLDTLVGWSADGVEWEWSTVGDAFGISEGEPLTRLAVGEDFVLANVVIYEDSFDVNLVTDPRLGVLTYPMPTGPAQSRWFIAETP